MISCEDASVLRVLEDGRVEGVKPGTATVTVTYPDGKTEKLTVTVKAARGDVNFDGDVNAEDAAIILVYAAEAGAGETAVLYSADDADAESEAKQSADIDGNGVIDAVDAANLLIYAAILGAEGTADWADVLRQD